MSGLPGLKGEIKTDEQTKKAYSRDASIFEVVPQGVISPVDADDIKKIVTMATKLAVQGHPISLTARDAGTCMSGGSLTKGWVVDMKTHFNTIHPLDAYHKRLKVQGGVMHIEVEKATHPHGLYFPPYTSSHEICGIGGMIGNNASGEKSLQHGPTSSNIDRLKVILSDGNEYEFGPLTKRQLAVKLEQPGYEGDLYRGIVRILDDNKHLVAHHHPKTVKNAAGYALWELWNEDHTAFNLARLFIGSQGTLGIATEAEPKLVELPTYSRMIISTIDDLHALAPVVRTVLKHKPATCETFDRNTFGYAKRYYSDQAELARLADNKHITVLTIFEGDDQQELTRVSAAAQTELAQQGYDAYLIEDQKVIDAFLFIRRKSFGMMLANPEDNNHRAEAFIEDSVVPLEFLGDFLVELEGVLSRHQIHYAFHGHIGQGNIRMIPIIDITKPDAPKQIMELERQMNELVLKHHGSISADHNDGLIRTPYLQDEYGPHMIKLFEQVKNLFDPFHIFNPGKKVFGSSDYALAHIIRENRQA